MKSDPRSFWYPLNKFGVIRIHSQSQLSLLASHQNLSAKCRPEPSPQAEMPVYCSQVLHQGSTPQSSGLRIAPGQPVASQLSVNVHRGGRSQEPLSDEPSIGIMELRMLGILCTIRIRPDALYLTCTVVHSYISKKSHIFEC